MEAQDASREISGNISCWRGHNFIAGSGSAQLIGRRFDAVTYAMANVVELTAPPPAPLPAPAAPATFDWLPPVDSAGAVPEPSSWLMLITGFGLAGVALRRQRAATARSASASAWSLA
ncbi:MAG: PEP-CTERM sorting domain-containing protein [Alphaproteobacteria bacterium]|nr:PEP-CTERM sorting domain-containing protein [Alphaproteobacteria bacterium]